MELREPILAAQKARLAEVLETPSLTGATRQNVGWIPLLCSSLEANPIPDRQIERCTITL